MSFPISPAIESISLSHFHMDHMAFGKETNLPVDTALIPKHSMSQDARLCFEDLLEHLNLPKDIAVSNMQNAQSKSKQYFDQKAKEPNFALHDRVLLNVSHNPAGLSPKLFQKCEGPYYIVQLGPNFTYKLSRCSDHKLIKSLINASRICNYKDPFILRDVPQAPCHAPEAVDEASLQADNQDDIVEVPDDTAPDPPNDNPAPDPPENNQIPGPQMTFLRVRPSPHKQIQTMQINNRQFTSTPESRTKSSK